jgi:TatD DNase family protein
MMLDSHCHLNDEKLFVDREVYIEKARKAGVGIMLVVGWDVESSKKAVQITHEYQNVFASVGVHPENIDGISDSDLETIKDLAKDPKVLAIGEIGLDYHWVKEESNHLLQREWFIKQINLANEMGLPISVHARDASKDTYDILKTHPAISKGVLHCYSGSPEMLIEFEKLGYYFGFDGPITYKGATTPKENVRICPLDRLLSETDSPYLSPVPFRGQINEPSRVVEIVKEMAELRSLDRDLLEKTILLNFEKLFHVEL